MEIIRFIKNWTLPIAMLSGVAGYFIYVNIPFLEPTRLWVNSAVHFIQPALVFTRKQDRNKINNLSDSPLFTFHLVSSFALGRIQSYFLRLSISCRYRMTELLQPKEKRTVLWSLSHIFIETCVLREGSCFYKTIGI